MYSRQSQFLENNLLRILKDTFLKVTEIYVKSFFCLENKLSKSSLLMNLLKECDSYKMDFEIKGIDEALALYKINYFQNKWFENNSKVKSIRTKVTEKIKFENEYKIVDDNIYRQIDLMKLQIKLNKTGRLTEKERGEYVRLTLFKDKLQ